MYTSVPLMYSGQELPNYKRLQFFDKDVIEWESNIALQDFYTAMYDVRKRNEILFANAEIKFVEDALLQNILCYRLQFENSEVIVCLNFRGEHTNYTIKNIVGTYQNIFTKEKHSLENEFIFSVETGGYLVLEKIGQ
jgi:alpha-amylase